MPDFTLRLVTGQRELDSLAARLASAPALALALETVDWWDRRLERVALVQLAFREGTRLGSVAIIIFKRRRLPAIPSQAAI